MFVVKRYSPLSNSFRNVELTKKSSLAVCNHKYSVYHWNMLMEEAICSGSVPMKVDLPVQEGGTHRPMFTVTFFF